MNERCPDGRQMVKRQTLAMVPGRWWVMPRWGRMCWELTAYHWRPYG